MTIIEHEYYQCAVCGATSQHETLISTYNFEKSKGGNLDFRPACTNHFPREISAFQQCPKCRYIAKNIEDDVSDEIRAFVRSDEYKKFDFTKSDGQYEALLRLSLMKNDHSTVLFASRQLAWIFDDKTQSLENELVHCENNNISSITAIKEQLKDAYEKAQDYRHIALDILENHRDSLTIEPIIIHCIMADMYRRCGDFARALQLCKSVSSTNEDISDILYFEAYLSSQKDLNCHTIYEAKKYCTEHPEAKISIQNSSSAPPLSYNTWRCAQCGHEGNTSSYCSECGSIGWICPKCNHKWNTGRTCDICNTPKPLEEIKKGWSCPECHHRGNTGKICRNCGKPKPQLEPWDCPFCKQKGNLLEECSNCGFSFWDRHDPMAISFYETTWLKKLIDIRKEKEK